MFLHAANAMAQVDPSRCEIHIAPKKDAPGKVIKNLIMSILFAIGGSIGGALLGGAIGFVVAGPVGASIGVAIGAYLGGGAGFSGKIGHTIYKNFSLSLGQEENTPKLPPAAVNGG